MSTKRLLLPMLAIALLAVSFSSICAQRKGESPAAMGDSREGGSSSFAGTFIGKASADFGGGPVPYVYTQTFHDDGSTESNASIELVPPAASTARGQWQYLGGNRIAVTTVGYLINSVTDPTLVGTFKIRSVLTFNRRRDEIIDGRTQVDILDVDGNLLFSFGVTSLDPAKRVKVEVLP